MLDTTLTNKSTLQSRHDSEVSYSGTNLIKSLTNVSRPQPLVLTSVMSDSLSILEERKVVQRVSGVHPLDPNCRGGKKRFALTKEAQLKTDESLQAHSAWLGPSPMS